jgi:putative transcriptional regulator
MRVFLGYSGWGPGQLAEEITSGAWLLATPDNAVLFGGSAETMWERVLRNMGIEPVQLVHSGVMH